MNTFQRFAIVFGSRRFLAVDEHPRLSPHKSRPPVGSGTNAQVGDDRRTTRLCRRARMDADKVERLVMAARRLREIIFMAETRARKRIKRPDFVHFTFRFERADLISSGKCDFHICAPKGPNTGFFRMRAYMFIIGDVRAHTYIFRTRIRRTGRRNWRGERGPFVTIESIYNTDVPHARVCRFRWVLRCFRIFVYRFNTGNARGTELLTIQAIPTHVLAN